MSLKKFVVIPLIIGVLAFFIQIVDQLLSPSMPPEGNVGFGWIAFQSWAVYFLAGCNVKGGIKAFISYGIGIIASILIMVLGGIFSTSLTFFGLPLAVGLIAFLAIFGERNEWTSLIPALFIGAGAFFGFMSYVPGATFGIAAFTIMVYCVIGLIFGFVTVALRSRYEAKVSKEDASL